MSDNSTIKISGSIGMTILKNINLDKKVFIFYDDHSNKKYCEGSNLTNNNKIFLNDLFESMEKIIDLAFVLEEPFTNSNSQISILWEDSVHLLMFRKFYAKLIEKCSNKKICKVFPADIRIELFSFSPDLIINNLCEVDSKYKIPTLEYFNDILYLFDIGNYSIPENNYTILFIKKVFSIYKKSEFYIRLKDIINKFVEKYNILNTELSIVQLIKLNFVQENFVYEKGFPFTSKENCNFINLLDKISSGIMELYSTILILLLPNKNIIYYAGYYHSNNISHILKSYYNFELIYSIGTTNTLESSTPITSCLTVDKNIFNL